MIGSFARRAAVVSLAASILVTLGASAAQAQAQSTSPQTVGRYAACRLITDQNAALLSGMAVGRIHRIGRSTDHHHGANCHWGANEGGVWIEVGPAATRQYHRYLRISHHLSGTLAHARWFAHMGYNAFALIKTPTGMHVLLVFQGETKSADRKVLTSAGHKVENHGV